MDARSNFVEISCFLYTVHPMQGPVSGGAVPRADDRDPLVSPLVAILSPESPGLAVPGASVRLCLQPPAAGWGYHWSLGRVDAI